MVTLRAVGFIFGLILVAFAATMLVPLALDLVLERRESLAFAQSAGVTAFVGGLLALGSWPSQPLRLTARDGFLITAIAWLGAAVLGSLPFVLSQERLAMADAFFEAVSGLTATGSTVIVGLDKLPKALLLWRAMLQGIGGIGIIVMAVAVLPFLRVGGMQLFRSESSDRYDKPLPRAADIASATVLAYLVLMVLCAAAYWLLGMSPFDAITHAIPTVATGGFANYDQSFAFFASPALEWTATLFMFLGACPLVLYVWMALGSWREVQRNSQVRRFATVIAAASIAMAFWLWATRDTPPGEAVRLATFHVVSVITTTGFAAADYGQWGGFTAIIFLALMFIGGCTGSTAGGIKVMRFEILALLGTVTLRRLLQRHVVLRLSYQGHPVGPEIINSVTIFCFVYFVSFAALAAALAATGLDFATAISGSATSLGNVGPGLGGIIGPAGTFKPLPDSAKWLCAIGMLMGRLEFMAVLVLLTRRFWRG
jgi:trk system potassium uptake protein TrkH